MKNGTTSSRWFRRLDLEKGNVADLARWIDEAWSTGSFTWFVRAVLGDCCRVTLVLGRLSMAVFDAGARIGLGRSSTTRCATTYARPKSARWHRLRRLSIASRSRSPTKRENAATTREKRGRAANGMWRWTVWD